MTYRNTRRGFTLIELLVVVLIIGILAAVAVTQYQKAVQKSRAIQLQTVLSSIVQASNSYYLQTGEYPYSFDQLDIDFDLPTGARTCASDWIVTQTKKGDGFEISLFSGGIDHKYRLGVFFTEGRYKCTGFAHILRNNMPTLANVDGKSFCVESYYNRSCGTNCDNGDFCNKVMGMKHLAYFDVMDIYE